MLPSLYAAYSGICSYSCHWIPCDTGADMVDTSAEDEVSNDAYEWRNYRLVCQLLSSPRVTMKISSIPRCSRKPGGFVIEFPSLMVKPAPVLGEALHDRVKKTRDVLGLNDDATCMMMRQQFVTDYPAEEINFAHLEKRAPFLALQMKEQGLRTLAAIQR